MTADVVAASARMTRLRARTRDLISQENRALRDLSCRGRDTHRALLLAFVSGYLGAFCDQLDRDEVTDPHEICAVLRGVLDAVDADPRRPRETP